MIDFRRVDRNLSTKSWGSYFQSKKRKSKVIRRSLKQNKKKKKPQLNRPADCDHVHLRRSRQQRSLQVSFQNCYVLDSLMYNLDAFSCIQEACLFFFSTRPAVNLTFLGAVGGLAELPCRWRINRPSAKLVVDSFQLCFGNGSNSYFPHRFRNEK